MAGYYRVLGVSRFANRDEIRAAYWALTRRVRRTSRHRADPALDARLLEIRRAFDTLSDATRRQHHDAQLASAAFASGGRDSRGARPSGSVPPRALVAERRDGGVLLTSDEAWTGFPSMRRLVPRMRGRFHGDAALVGVRTHRERVALTPAQARSGTCLELDVPVHPSCPVCGGRGEMWPRPCAVCDGTGEGRLSQRVHFAIPPRVRDGSVLRFAVTPPFAAEHHVELRLAVD